MLGKQLHNPHVNVMSSHFAHRPLQDVPGFSTEGDSVCFESFSATSGVLNRSFKSGLLCQNDKDCEACRHGFLPPRHTDRAVDFTCDETRRGLEYSRGVKLEQDVRSGGGHCTLQSCSVDRVLLKHCPSLTQ